MSSSEEKDFPTNYLYHFFKGVLAREEVETNKCAKECYEFFIDGEWKNNDDLSLQLYEKRKNLKYLYYYFKGNIAREEVGNTYCASNRFEFYRDGKWINFYNLSLHLSDATMNCCGYTFGDYEELTEEDAMRRIADIDNK